MCGLADKKVLEGIRYPHVAETVFGDLPSSCPTSVIIIYLFIYLFTVSNRYISTKNRHAERVVLYELSNLASKKSNILKLDTELSLNEMEDNRLQLKALVYLFCIPPLFQPSSHLSTKYIGYHDGVLYY